ncbi:MAG: type II toxin-antitoxin system RelE/ParE family toxin [Nitrospinae bacterium]|nr:type II toxin-antitoxin system RelE/ParE family toxin [Nitrospinota bacterium]
MEILETSKFARDADDYLEEEDLEELKLYLAIQPDSGVVIPGSGGCRKLRWKGRGRGKRGGYRVIYFYRKMPEQIWLLTIYSKSELENIHPTIIKRWRQEIES